MQPESTGALPLLCRRCSNGGFKRRTGENRDSNGTYMQKSGRRRPHPTVRKFNGIRQSMARIFSEKLWASTDGAPLGVTHCWRTLSGLQNKPYAKWPSLGLVASAGGATPVALRPCALACASCGSAGHHVLARPPWRFAATRHQHGAGSHPPPKGLPQARAALGAYLLLKK